jgi:hypothetical protein
MLSGCGTLLRVLLGGSERSTTIRNTIRSGPFVEFEAVVSLDHIREDGISSQSIPIELELYNNKVHQVLQDIVPCGFYTTGLATQPVYSSTGYPLAEHAGAWSYSSVPSPSSLYPTETVYHTCDPADVMSAPMTFNTLDYDTLSLASTATYMDYSQPGLYYTDWSQPDTPVSATFSSADSSPIHTPPFDERMLSMPRAARLDHHRLHPDTCVQPMTSYVNVITPTCSMINNWTTAELRSGRRLVKFAVTQLGDGYVTVSCVAISASEYLQAPLEDTISCIRDPSEQTWCITSVDLLRLANLLYGMKAPVPEKNRLRRHLEKAGPRTIGKNNDTTHLFSRLAGYTQPTPLSIVKDVKIFDWARLPEALEFMVAKRVCYLLFSRDVGADSPGRLSTRAEL